MTNQFEDLDREVQLGEAICKIDRMTYEGSNHMFAAPALSVFITNYNHAEYLSQSIESVLNQTFKDFELIIVDDGSTDNSLDIICHYKELDPRIRVQIFDVNTGAIHAANHALEMCRGLSVFPRAADDYLTDMSFFEKAMNAFHQYPTAAGVFGASAIIKGETDVPYGMMGMCESGGYISPYDACDRFLDRTLFIPGASAIWRRQFFESFDAALGPQADYYNNHVLPMQYGVVDLHCVVATVRHFDGAMSKQDVQKIKLRHYAVERKIREVVPGNDLQWDEWRAAL